MRIERFAAHDGDELSVQVSGQGPPVVLLHEWASSHRVWEPIAHRLIDRFTVYRWDARGHGRYGHQLPPRQRPTTVEHMADDLRDLIDHFRLQRPCVVGHSMGALTLWAHIGRHGCQRLGRIAIIDQSPRLQTADGWPLGIYGEWTAERDAAFLADLRSDFVETLLRLIAHGLNSAARRRYELSHASQERLRTYFAMLDPAPLIEVWPTLSGADFRPVLPSICVPALLVYGTQSNFYPPATGPWVRDAIPVAELRMYEGADHSPHVGFPDRFAADLAAFIDAAAVG